MWQTIALFLFTTIPRTEVIRESVDLIEVNHFYDDNGRLVFDQIVYYDWYAKDERFQAREWSLIKDPNQVPHYDHGVGAYVSRFHCHTPECERYIVARSLTETWTQYDPELTEREYLAKELRVPLRRPPLRKYPRQTIIDIPANTEDD